MADSSDKSDDTTYHMLEADLSCSLCMSLFKDPRILPCNHRLCAECIETLTAKKKKFKCPIDRSSIKLPPGGVEAFPGDFIISSLVEKLKLQKLKAEKEEKIYSTKRMSIIFRCPRHKQYTIIAYCSNCYENVCQICMTSFHKGHKFDSVEEAWDKQIDPMRKKAELIRNEMLPRVNGLKQQILQNLDETSKVHSGMVAQLKDDTNVFRNCIDKREHQMLEYLDDHFKGKTAGCQKVLDLIEKQEQKMNNVAELIEDFNFQECDDTGRDIIKQCRVTLKHIDILDTKISLPGTLNNRLDLGLQDTETLEEKLKPLLPMFYTNFIENPEESPEFVEEHTYIAMDPDKTQPQYVNQSIK